MYRLAYNSTTDSYYNTANVDVIAPGVGNVTLLDTIDTYEEFFINNLTHYLNFTNYFVTKHGYERGKDLRGAPYDWRLAPGICYYVCMHTYVVDPRSINTMSWYVACTVDFSIARVLVNAWVYADSTKSYCKRSWSLS